MDYVFYYDESEHSRKINYKTVTAKNYYDNFVAVILGWDKAKLTAFQERYTAFEERYGDRKSKGELKSTTIKQSQFEYGFASMNEANISLLRDYLNLFNEDLLIYFAVESKMEYIVLQIFSGYHNSIFFDADLMRYTITKLLLTYRPDEVIRCAYENPEMLVNELKRFIRDRIEKNEANKLLKETENEAMEQVLTVLDHVEPIREIDWQYYVPFDGFLKYLNERQIENYELIIDRENKTAEAAMNIGIQSVTEEDSKNEAGIRCADMLAGIIGKLMKALDAALSYRSDEEETKKKLLDKKWFELSRDQLDLYKRMYKVICVLNNNWYKSYAGVYSDNLIAMVALLEFMNHFESTEKIENPEVQGEYFNSCVCEKLNNHFHMMRNKPPLEPVPDDGKDFFLNQRGAKVFYDISRQPVLEVKNGERRKVMVLSVGVDRSSVPLITLAADDGENKCYRIPDGLSEWAETMVGYARLGEKLFPAEVIFTNIGDNYYADIL